MRVPKYVLLLVAFSLAIGFGAGLARENLRMDAFCGALLQGTNAGNSVDLLRMHETAIESIRNGDLAKAEKILHALSRADAQSILGCEKEPNCSRWSGFEGNRPPDDALVQRALADK